MLAQATIRVEVAYVGPEGQWLLALNVPEGTTAVQALERSGLRNKIGAEHLQSPRLGIFSRPVAPDQVLRDGDRLEVYRPLQADPKDARRTRAADATRTVREQKKTKREP